jgi:VCBS repeat-containing protein
MAVALALTLYPSVAAAGWRVGEGTLFLRDERVCRDGIVMTAAWRETKEEIIASGSFNRSTAVSVRLYDNTTFPPPESSNYTVHAYYGPLLVPWTGITGTYHENYPMPADFFDNGTIFDVYIYNKDQIIPWSRLLDVGSKVAITNGLANWHATVVEDCYVNQLALDEGATATIGSGKLKVIDAMTSPSDLVYRIDTLPAHGTLRLDGSALGIGSYFTQADVDGNRLTYRHDGSETASDGFAFTVGGTTRVSVGTGGIQATGGFSSAPSMSGNGSRIAFQSSATNLASPDSNNLSDIFLHDRGTLSTTLISAAAFGGTGNAASFEPALSPDGFAVAFVSGATNLVTGSDCGVVGNDGTPDVFLRSGSTTSRRSVSSTRFGTCEEGNAGSFAPSISSFGSNVAFESVATNLRVKEGQNDTNSASDVFINTTSFGGTTDLVSSAGGFNDTLGSGASSAPSISVDGDAVAYQSYASNLVTPASNGLSHIFVASFSSARQVSVATGGAQGNNNSFAPSISATGRFVTFYSYADNLVSGDSNNLADIFVHDRDTDGDEAFDEAEGIATTRVSVASNGAEAIGGSSFTSAISAGGRYVVFQSAAGNLVSGDTNLCPSRLGMVNCSDIFVHDRLTGQTTRVSVSRTGEQANGASFMPSISWDGSYVAFESNASNLVEDDTNGQRDIFVRYRGFSSLFPITINPVNDAPAASNNTYHLNEDSILSVAAPGVLGNDTDAEGHALTAATMSDPARGTLIFNADGTFTYDPAENFNGADSFTYRVSDSIADSNVATVAINIEPVNDAPAAQNDSYAVNEDATLTIAAPGLLGNDTDVENSSLTAVQISNPSHGILTLNNNGSFTYKPAVNFNGSDSFTYRASDGAASSNPARITIRVNPVNERIYAPVVRR